MYFGLTIEGELEKLEKTDRETAAMQARREAKLKTLLSPSKVVTNTYSDPAAMFS